MDQPVTEKSARSKETLDDLITKIELGVSSAAGRTQMEDFLFKSLIKEVRNIADCDPEFNVLLDIRARIRALMLLAQQQRFQILEGEVAKKKLSDLYAVKK